MTEKEKNGGVIISGARYPTFLPKRKKLVEMTLRGSYDEDHLQRGLIGISTKREPAFYKLVRNIEEINKRSDAYGILIKLDDYSLSKAQYEELRSSLLRLKNGGKKVIFFAHSYNGLAEYNVVAVADYIILATLGDVTIPGVWARKFYLKGTLEKLGLETDIEHVGKYKSAQELFSRKDMSDADQEQWNAILDDVYSRLVEQTAGSRGLTREDYECLINEPGYFNSEEALASKLIDTTAFFYDVDEVVKKYAGRDIRKQPVKDFVSERTVARFWKEKTDKIALVIGEGSIVVGKSSYNPTPVIGGKYMGSETVAKIFEKIRKDKSIKAVVFRINSGGGSALASDIIAEAVRRCDQEKPVIVSMGAVAGSGGYYIACLARKILADHTTITGSIGVVSIKMVTPRFYDEKLGITWDWIKRGKHIDGFSDMRHFDEEEQALLRRDIEWWYDKFIDRVAVGRKLGKSFVDSVGQGRIWSGKRAKELGLVDEIGGLVDAIELAKKEAGLRNEVELMLYPKPERHFNVGGDIDNDLLKLIRERRLYLMPYNIVIE